MIQGSNQPYFTIKLKIAVDEYITIRAMLSKSSGVTTDIFKAKKANLVPLAVKKIPATSNYANFYNSYRVSLPEDALFSVTFKKNENSSLDIRDLKNKEQGEYTLTGIRWMGNVKKIYTQNSSNKNSARENTYGHYRSYATNSQGGQYWLNNRNQLVPNKRYSYQKVLWYQTFYKSNKHI